MKHFRCRRFLHVAVLMLAPFYAAGEAPPEAAPPPGWGPEQWQATRDAIQRLADMLQRGIPDQQHAITAEQAYAILEKQDPLLVLTCASDLECADAERLRDLYCDLAFRILRKSTDVAVRQEAVERLLHMHVCGRLTVIGSYLEGLTAADFNDRAKAYLRANAYQREPEQRTLVGFCGVANLQDLKPVLRTYVSPAFEPFVEPAADCVTDSLALARLGDARELDRWLAAFAELPVSWDGGQHLPSLSYLRSLRAVPILARWLASDARSPYQEHAPKGVPLWPRALDALADTVDGLPIPSRPTYQGYSEEERAKVLEWLKTQTAFKMKP